MESHHTSNPVGLSPGCRVGLLGHDNDWIYAGLGSIPDMVELRSLEPDVQTSGDPRYLRIDVPAEELRSPRHEFPTPGVVTRLEGAQLNGFPIKMAVVDGQRSPLIAADNPDWERWVLRLREKGLVVPENILVVMGPDDSLPAGAYTLTAVIDQDAKLADGESSDEMSPS